MSLDFGTTGRRPRGESIVPMINVVFLLLIFFLMTSTLAPPDPFAVQPPVAPVGENGVAGPVLYLSGAGEIAFRELRGDDAIAALASEITDADAAPQVRADATVRASDLARLLKTLAGAGLGEVALVVAPE
ncbi:ExbD/TolR family protein [Sedimentitalea arenosa]|nr:biopolymer transporter ExbD [Arenibacterium arenosum]